MEKIIITEPGNIPVETKKKLTEKGFIIIEAKNPEKVKILSEMDFGFVSGNDLFMSAMKGVAVNDYSQHSMKSFVSELHKRLIEKEKK